MFACQKADVGHYYFMTQEAPHAPLTAQLVPVVGTSLLKRVDRSTYAPVNLPYVLSGEDHFFQGSGNYTVAQDDIPVWCYRFMLPICWDAFCRVFLQRRLI